MSEQARESERARERERGRERGREREGERGSERERDSMTDRNRGIVAERQKRQRDGARTAPIVEVRGRKEWNRHGH